MRTPSPSKSPSRAGSARWPRDPSYLTDSWAPGTPRTSPFRESDPAHFWKPFGTNKVGYEELDAAVFSDRLDILKGPELPTTPRSRFREREAVAEKHRVRYRTLSAADEARHGHSERVAADPPGLDDAEAETQATAAVRSSREAVPDGDDAFQQQTVQPYKVSVFLKLGGTQPAPQVVQKTRGYGDQFYSNIVTSNVSHDGIPSRPAPAAPAKALDSRGVLLRRSVAAVTGSVMCDVTVDSLMNQQTGESVDPSLGVVATPRSAVVMAATDFSEKPQDGSRAPSSAAQEPAATSAAEQPEKPAVNWRRFSTDPAAQGDQEQRTPRGIHPGRPLLYTPEKFDILSRLQMLDRGEPASAVEPPLLTTVGIWVPSVAAAKSTAAALRDAAASGALQASFQERGLESTVELLNIEHDEEPPPPPPPPEPEPEVEEDSDDESVRAAQVPKAELLYRLFSSGRGFRRLLYASFLQNSLEHVPEQRVVHVTEGPYMHSTFLLREPLWTGMSMRLALIALMHPEDRSTDSDDEAAHAQNPYDFRAPVEEEDAVWPLWILPNAAALARKGLLREALEVAERELATNVAMSSTNANHGTDPNFDVSASVFERLVVLQNIMALDLITRCPKGSDALHILLRAEVLTRSRDPAAGGSPCCSCNSAFSHARAAHSARGSAGPRCNRGLLRVATLTNLAAYYRRKGLLNAGHQYMYRAVKLSLRRRLPATGGDEWAVDDGNVSEAAVCLSVPPQCRAAARINQGALLIMMRSYEEGLKCSSAALSRLQEEWAKGRLSLRDPLQDTRNAHLARGSPNGTKSLVMRQRDARLAAGRGLRGLVSESMAMVTEIAVCMYNAGVCHEQLYRAPAALQAYLRTQAVLSLIPRQHPTAGALQQLLGPEGLLRVQMADLAQSRSARTPAGQRARPWRPSTAGTNDTASLVNAAWGDDSEMEGEWEGVPREGESAVLQDFSQFLQQDGEQGGRANGAGNVSPFKRARERNWKSSLAVVSDLEPGAGRQSDGGPDRSWPANRSGGGRVGGVFGINSSLSGSRSAARPQTATGLGQVRTISEGRAEGDVSVDSPGWNLVSPQRPRTSGGMERQSTAQDAAAPTHLAGGFRSRLRDELGASRRATAAGMLAVKYGASNDSLVDKMAPEGSAEWEHGDEGPQEEQVFWGGRSRKPTSVVPVVLRGKEADSAGRPRRAGDWRWGAPVNVAVASWNCYDGTVSATPKPMPVSPDDGAHGPASRADGWSARASADVLARRDVITPRERPVTAPDGASRANRVLKFAPSPQRHDVKRPIKAQVLASEEAARAPGQAPPRRRLPSAPPTRSNKAVYAHSAGGNWTPPEVAKGLFARMQTAQAPEHVNQLDFSTLSGPVIRQSEAPGTASHYSLYSHPPPAATGNASQLTRRQMPRPASSHLKTRPAHFGRARPGTAAAGGRHASSSLTNHDFLDQARAIVQQREKQKQEDQGHTDSARGQHVQRSPEHAHAAARPKPSPPATARGSSASASGPPRVPIRRPMTAGSTPSSPARAPTAPTSPSRAFPSPPRLSVTEALTAGKSAARPHGAPGKSAALSAESKSAPSSGKTSRLAQTWHPATAPPPTSDPPPAAPPPPPAHPQRTGLSWKGGRGHGPGVRMLEKEEARLLGREEGRARAATAAIAAARARVKGGDVVDMDELDRLRLEKQRQRAQDNAARLQRAAEATEQEMFDQQQRASAAALVVQGAYQAHKARCRLRWKYWHSLACVLQRAFRARRARTELKTRKIQHHLRVGIKVPEPQKVVSGVSQHLAAVRPPASVSSNSSRGAAAQVVAQKRVELLEKTKFLRRDEAEHRLHEEAGTSRARGQLSSHGAAASHNGGDMQASRTPAWTQVKISVKRAENLVAKDRGGTSDPFVQVRVGNVARKTAVVAKTLNPCWNESFIFDLPSDDDCAGRGRDGAQGTVVRGSVEIVVYDHDKGMFFGSSAEYLGSVSLDLSALAAAHPSAETLVPLQFEAKYKQKPELITGSILLGFDFLPQRLEQEHTGAMTDQGSAEEAVATQSTPLLDDSTLNSQHDVDDGKDSNTDRTLENKERRADGGSGPLLSEASLEHENKVLPRYTYTAAVKSLPAAKSGGDEAMCEEHLPAFPRASSPCSPRGLGIEENEPEPGQLGTS